MKLTFYNRLEFTSGDIKNSYDFLFFYFNDIMTIQCDDFNWKPEVRYKEMKLIIDHYRILFHLSADVYSDVYIWKQIIKKYRKKWDILLYDSHNYEKTLSKGMRYILYGR